MRATGGPLSRLKTGAGGRCLSWAALCVILGAHCCAPCVLSSHTPEAHRALHLRGGSGHQGSDPNAKDPTGQWSSFSKVGGDDGRGVGFGLRTVANVWGQASCRRRSQSDITFRVTAPAALSEVGIVATCEGTTFCNKTDAPDPHHICCQCECQEVTTVRIPVKNSGVLKLPFKGSGRLTPGHYKIKFTSGLQVEELQGMHGIEEYRPLTVLPAPKAGAVLLMSDIDGTLIGDQESTDKFCWIWNEQYRPRGAHLVYNTGRPFPSAHSLIKDNRLLVPTALVCSEGTEIYWFGPGGSDDVEADHEWREILMLSWEYDRIKAGVQAIVQQMQHEVNDAMFLYEMCAQPMIVINVADKGKADNMIGKLHHELRQTQQLQFDMTSSSGGGNWFILIIPKGASKGSAALHVSKRLGFAPEQVLVAGDGENDVPLFEATVDEKERQGFKGVIVGNAVEGLKSWVAKSPSSPRIHRSMSQQALGVLEGLEKHFPRLT